MENFIASISMSEIKSDKINPKKWDLHKNNIIEKNINSEHSITFNLNDNNLPPYFEQLGYKSEADMYKNIVFIDMSTGNIIK